MKGRKNVWTRIVAVLLVVILLVSGTNHFAVKAATTYPLMESYYDCVTSEGEHAAIVAQATVEITARSTTTPPIIDGVLDDLWGAPQLEVIFTLNSQTHPLKGYFLYDDHCLYIAVEVKEKELHDYYPGAPLVDVMEVYFDNNNNEVVDIGETVLNFWGLRFGDWIYKGGGTWGTAPSPSGASGVASHSNPGGRGDYVYEFEIPRNLFLGDTVGIKMNYRVMEYDSENNWYTWSEEFLWPIGYRFDGATYAKLRLPPAEGVGRVILIEPLNITPAGPYFVENTLTATFAVKNVGDVSITLDKLLLAGRYNDGELPGGGYPDFTYQTVTLQPGQTHEYQGTFTIPEPGDYHFFIAYHIENPTEAEKEFLDENNWNTSIELGEGLTDADRTRGLTASPAAEIKITKWEVTNLYEISWLQRFLWTVLELVGDTVRCDVDVYVTGDEFIEEIEIAVAYEYYRSFIDLQRVAPGHYRAELRLGHLEPKKIVFNIIQIMATLKGADVVGVPYPTPEIFMYQITVLDTDGEVHHITQSESGQSLPERLPNLEDAIKAMLPGPWSTQEGTLYGGFSPIDLLVIDSHGRRVGALYEGGVFVDEVNEIPNAVYWGRELDFQFIFVPDSSGDDVIQVVGVQAGNYILNALSLKEKEAGTFAAAGIPTSIGATHQYTIDWEALSQGEEGVTVKVDSGGDGVFESTFTTGSELTGDEFIAKTTLVKVYLPLVFSNK